MLKKKRKWRDKKQHKLKMEKVITKIKNTMVNGFLMLTAAWIMFALTFQVYGVFLIATGQDEKMSQISNEISWKIDGTFKNNPDNIWYEGSEK